VRVLTPSTFEDCTGLAELTPTQGGFIAKTLGYAADPALTAPQADEGFITSWVANMITEWKSEVINNLET
jgi:hypothetical protein